jgi:diguanylate cyclase (GGDEF)-like protein
MSHTRAVVLGVLLLVIAPGYVTGPPAAWSAMDAPAILALDSGQVTPRSLAGGAAAIIVGLLLLLYLHRRQVHILYWIGAWGCFAASMFTGATRATGQLGAFVYGLSQFLGIASALFFLFAGDAYGPGRRLRHTQLLVLLPAAVWFLLAPVALGPAWVFGPGHLLMGLVLVVASAAHLLILRSARLLGAAMVGMMLLAVAFSDFWVALGPRGDVSDDLFLLQLALYFVIALGTQLMTFEDMTQELRTANGRLETAQSELRQMVVTDALTGCRNRRFFDEVITHELNNHRRYATPLSLLFVDVDHFKTINDTLGHSTGDRVLKEVAAFLMRKTRDADYVFRWGGDEFLLLLECREEEAVRRGRELQDEFAAPDVIGGLPPGVGLSVGSAEIAENADHVHDALKLADERMYANKRRSRIAGVRAV